MRRGIAVFSIVLLLAGCGRTMMATGAVLTMGGGLAVGTGVAAGGSSGGDPLFIGLGSKSLLIGLILLTGGYGIARAEDWQAEENARLHAEQHPPAPPPPPIVEEPPPPPPPRTVRDTGVWREVPAVYGDDAP